MGVEFSSTPFLLSKKKYNSEWMAFSKSAKRGYLFIILIVVAAVLLPRILASLDQTELVSIKKVPQEIKKAIQKVEEKEEKRYSKKSTTKFKLQPPKTRFNPNDLNIDEWQKLGLSEKQAKSILNYTSKGGKFYKPEDLQKMYVISDEFYNTVKDSIDIPENNDFQKNKYPDFTKPDYANIMVELNSADKEQLIKLNGIGEYFAEKIIGFRDKLGGFHSKEQIKEVYNFKPETYEKIKNQITVNQSDIIKLNINTATAAELQKHPYIDWKVANSIVNYRKQHGNYKDLDGLLQSVLINRELLDKFAPYLAI